MSDLVRVRVGDREYNAGRSDAERRGLTILDDEPTHTRAGNPRPETRVGGREVKPKTTVAKRAAAKKGASRATRSQKRGAANPAPSSTSTNASA